MFGQNYNMNKQIALKNSLRQLWEQHSFWTRSFIISTAAGLGDLDLVTKRLLRNPSDFANLLKKYYNNDKAETFQKLLEQHLLIAGDMVNAAKAGFTEDVAAYRKRWYENADMIAAFLAGINPNWNEKKWQNLLYDHLKMVEAEAIQRLNRQYDADIKTFDQIENQSLQMEDYMASGIINQFFI